MPKLYIETPLLESTPLSNWLGIPVFLKMEALQPSGSFKNRGIGKLCTHYAKQGAKFFISSSGGNAGLAVAYSGRKLQIPVKVIVPTTTSSLMLEKIRLEKATVVVRGKDWNEADEYARSLLHEKRSFYISPFDHPLIWEGHSTLIEEVYRAQLKPGAIIVAVGGGGLFCGVLQGLHKVGWKDVPVIIVETEGAASFAASLKAGKLVKLKKIDTLATSLGAREVAKTAFEWTRKHEVISEIVTDKAAVEGVLKFANDHRILVEPACGAPLSLVYNRLPLLNKFSSILVIVCGGSGVTLEMCSTWKEKTGARIE
jgi:L-serine/L-threonine ammonia-lyase